MIIEVWFDVACPFCYISKRRLDKVLNEFAHKDSVEIVYKSLELNPNADLYDGTSYYEAVTSERRISMLRAKMFTSKINEQAKDVGLTFNYDDLKQTNTFDAHRLIKLAKEFNHEDQLIENLFAAHFIEAKDIGNIETLVQIAEESGMDKVEASKVLEDKSLYKNEMRQDEREAEQRGVSGVPYVIFNEKHVLAGAQPTIAFSRTLQQAWEDAEVSTKLSEVSSNNKNEITCVGDSCTIPPKSN